MAGPDSQAVAAQGCLTCHGRVQQEHDQNQEKDEKIAALECQITEMKTKLVVSDEQRQNAVKAMKKTVSDKSKLEDDYKEVGHQLVRVWPSEHTSKFKCYDCGEEVGERSNLIQHKKQKHYKLKNCKSFHQNNYCRFSARECVYIHRPEERQWQAGGQEVQGRQVDQKVQGWQVQENIICKNGPGCYWLAQNRCRFRHEPLPALSVVIPPRLIVTNVETTAQPSNTSISSGSTMETFMEAIMNRLEKLELRMPPVRILTDFPPIEGGKKTQ